MSSGPNRRLRLPVETALVGGVSLLILAAVGGVILITFFTARTSTLELLRDRADLGLELLEVIETGISIVAMGGHDLHHGRG